ncbi:MAG TPA: hypothetical protein VFX59_23070 [Polyangiales bacterium]|nr:hypothetical protein [Polyangiales bacterium]
MATRKSEDGSRSADAGSDRPGSYVKVSGSRRRRKRRGSTMPPPGVAGDEARIVDTVGEAQVEERGFSAREQEEERIADRGVAVDDLRRGSKPSSNRPRKELGPLGIDDIRSEPPANSVGSDRPRTLNVIEINASESPRVEASGFSVREQHNDPFGEEITTESPVSSLFDDEDDEEPVPDMDRELAAEYALDDLRPAESDVRVSLQPVRDMLALRDEYELDDQRHSLSSVLGARPSLRPSPRPEMPSRDSASVLWWLVVAALVGIIAAAGAIAAREQFASEPEPELEPAPVAAPVVVEAIKPKPVSFGTPQTAPALPAATVEPAKVEPKVEARPANSGPHAPASPSPPRGVPAAQSAAVRAGAPYTTVVTGAASATKPNVPAPSASAVKPSERKPKPAVVAKPAAAEAPASNYAPGYGKSLEGTAYAPGYNPAQPAPAPARGKPNLAPAAETRDNELPGLPINPYE